MMCCLSFSLVQICNSAEATRCGGFFIWWAFVCICTPNVPVWTHFPLTLLSEELVCCLCLYLDRLFWELIHVIQMPQEVRTRCSRRHQSYLFDESRSQTRILLKMTSCASRARGQVLLFCRETGARVGLAVPTYYVFAPAHLHTCSFYVISRAKNLDHICCLFLSALCCNITVRIFPCMYSNRWLLVNVLQCKSKWSEESIFKRGIGSGGGVQTGIGICHKESAHYSLVWI